MGSRTSERVGLFGGTFDPPHVGHLVVAVNVRYELTLDRVLLTVANEPWQKTGTRPITPAADRLEMVRAAVEGVEGLEASDIEIRRGGSSYTVDTVNELLAEDPGREVFLVLGSDSAAGLDTWERAETLRELVTIVVVDRPGSEGVRPPQGYRHQLVEVPMLEVSSSDLRDRAAEGRPLEFLLTPEVIACIRARGLYGVRP